MRQRVSDPAAGSDTSRLSTCGWAEVDGVADRVCFVSDRTYGGVCDCHAPSVPHAPAAELEPDLACVLSFQKCRLTASHAPTGHFQSNIRHSPRVRCYIIDLIGRAPEGDGLYCAARMGGTRPRRRPAPHPPRRRCQSPQRNEPPTHSPAGTECPDSPCP